MLYWQVGRRIQTELLKGERSEYGKQILPSLAEQLTTRYGKGWSRRNFSNMAQLEGWSTRVLSERIIAIDLKLGSFKAEYKGQMELYLRYLAKYEQETGENPPLGIILCAGNDLGSAKAKDKKEEFLSRILARLNELFITDGLCTHQSDSRA